MKNQKQDTTRGSPMSASKTTGPTPAKGPAKTGAPPKQAPKSK